MNDIGFVIAKILPGFFMENAIARPTSVDSIIRGSDMIIE